MSTYDELQLAALVGSLSPAPEAWVTAAQELPRAERDLHQILALAEADADFQKALIDDLESALQQAGIEQRPEHIRELQARLAERTEPDA